MSPTFSSMDMRVWTKRIKSLTDGYTDVVDKSNSFRVIGGKHRNARENNINYAKSSMLRDLSNAMLSSKVCAKLFKSDNVSCTATGASINLPSNNVANKRGR